MIRIKPPSTVWRSCLSYNARHNSRSWCRRGHNLLWTNLSLFSCHSRAGFIHAFFKRLFPAEINQPADNKYFD